LLGRNPVKCDSDDSRARKRLASDLDAFGGELELAYQDATQLELAGTADVIAIAGTGLASAFDAVPQIEASKIAVAHMEDATPLQIASGAQGAGVLATPTRSLWQSDTIGIKIRFNASWALRDPRALAWLTARW
jgi:hypothetical protein